MTHNKIIFSHQDILLSHDELPWKSEGNNALQANESFLNSLETSYAFYILYSWFTFYERLMID